MDGADIVDLADLRERARRLIDDLPFFASRCLTIRAKTGELRRLVFNPVQMTVHNAIERQRTRAGKVRMIVLKSRQPGISTYTAARFFHRVISVPGQLAYVLSHRDEATSNLFAITDRFLQHLPDLLRPHVAAANARELKFDALDSGFIVATAGARGAGRSATLQLFHGSEVAHWQNADEHVSGVLQAVPNVPGSEIILESTAAGQGNLFHRLCREAQRGTGAFDLVFVAWHAHAEYATEPPEGWTAPYDFARYGEAHGLSPAQLYWAWSKNAELAIACGGTADEPCWVYRQEYPADITEAFQSDGALSFIRSEIIAAARKAEYPEAASDVPLIFGVDIAHGGGDKSHVIDRCGRRMGHLVNEVWDERDEMVMAGKLAGLIDRFNPAVVFVDTTGGYGAGVVDRLRERRYPVRGINFGSKATDPTRHVNKRAEMWDGLRSWLLEGADIVDDDALATDLSAPTSRPDSAGRLALEAKDEIRRRLGRSPDRGDAAALTFAEPTVRRGTGLGHNPERAESDYPVAEYGA